MEVEVDRIPESDIAIISFQGIESWCLQDAEFVIVFLHSAVLAPQLPSVN